MKRLLYLLALIAVVAGSLAPSASAYSRHPELDSVASWLAGKPVTIRCLTPEESRRDPTISVWGASAYVEVVTDPATGRWLHPKNFSVFAYGLCEELMGHLPGEEVTEDYTWALLVIVHESGHLRGGSFPLWHSEHLVNCWALRRIAAVAQLRFGLLPEQVPELKRLAWRLYSHQPPNYVMSSCTLK